MNKDGVTYWIDMDLQGVFIEGCSMNIVFAQQWVEMYIYCKTITGHSDSLC